MRDNFGDEIKTINLEKKDIHDTYSSCPTLSRIYSIIIWSFLPGLRS